MVGYKRKAIIALLGLFVLSLTVFSTSGSVPRVYATSIDLSAWCVPSNGTGLSYSNNICTVNTSGSHVIVAVDVTVAKGETLLIPSTATSDTFGDILFINPTNTLTVDPGGNVTVSDPGTGATMGNVVMGIDNSGTIINNGNVTVLNTGGIGISIGGSNLINYGVITIKDSGSSGNVGTGIYANRMFENYGTITIANTATSFGIDDENISLSTTGNNGDFLNQGTMVISNSGTVGFSSSGTLTNTGSITISDSTTYYGVQNTGTIQNNSPGSITVSNTAGDGIDNEGGKIDNANTITISNSGGTGIYNSGTLTNSATINFECGGTLYGPVTGSGSSLRGMFCPPTLLIETKTSSGLGIPTTVSISGTNAPSSITTDSSGNYLFPSGALVQGDTYSVSATINGAPLSASLVLGGNSVIVLEPTPPSLPTPEFPLGVLMAILVTMVALVSFATIRMRQNRIRPS